MVAVTRAPVVRLNIVSAVLLRFATKSVSSRMAIPCGSFMPPVKDDAKFRGLGLRDRTAAPATGSHQPARYTVSSLGLMAMPEPTNDDPLV
jgi:hypothetical protein